MNRTAIYPYTKNNAYIYKALCTYRKDLNITSVIIPRAYSNNCDVPENTTAFSKIEDVLDSVDWIVFLPMWNQARLYNEILISIQAGVNVLCAVEFSDKQFDELKEAALKRNVTIEIDDSRTWFPKLNKRGDVYTQQESVVIAVGALTKGLSTSKHLLSIAEKLSERGYSVQIVASDPTLSALRFPILSVSRILEENLDHTIVQINRLFNYLQLKYRPNVILVQLPDEGIYRISNDYETCFGAETYLVSQAVDIDYCVMLSPLIDADPETFDFLSNVSKYRFGFDLNCVCVTHNIVDMGVAQGTQKMDYYIASAKNVEEVVSLLQKNSTGEIKYCDSESAWYKDVVEDIVDRCS